MVRTFPKSFVFSMAIFLGVTLMVGGQGRLVAQENKLDKARNLISEQRYEDAIKYLNSISVDSASAADQYILLADALLQTGAGIAAEAALDRARRLGADYAVTAVAFAKALLIQRKYDAALIALQGTNIPQAMQLDAFIISGDAYFATGKFAAAQREYEAATVLQPSDFQAYLGLARLQLRGGNLEKAKTFAEAAEQRAPNNTMVQYTMGLISRYVGEQDKAERHFEKAVALFSGNIMANIEMASIRINQGRIEEAEKHLDKVYASAPRQPMGLYLSGVILATKGQYNEAAALLNRARPLTDQYLPAVYVRGMVAYQLGNHAVAQESLEKVLAARPDNVAARLALASTYTQQNQPVTALQLLAPLLEAENVSVNTLTVAATAAVKAGDAAQAEAYYARAATLKTQGAPGGIEGLNTRLALAQYAVGDTEKALATLTTVTAGSATEIRELGLMGSMQIRAQEYDAAAETINRIIKINPALALGYNMRGTLEFKRGKFSDAIKSYTEALDRSPQYYAAHRNRGLAFMRLGEYKRAAADLKRLLEQQPDDVLAKAALGKSLLGYGEAEEAVGYFADAIRSLSRSAQLSADYSQALANSGNTSRAIEQARITAAMAADKPELLKRMGLLLLDLDQARAAERPLSRYAIFKADSGEAHMLHGRALLKMGLYTGASISFMRAENAPDDKPDKNVLNWYFFAAETLGQKYSAANARVRSLNVSVRPKDVSASIIGDLQLATGEPVKAEQSYRHVLKQQKASDVIIGLSRALLAQGREVEATAELKEYVKKTPDDRRVREVLGLRYESLGLYKEAGEQYEAILRIGVADAKVAARLASIYLRLGNNQSVRLIERAHLLMPEDPYVLDVHGWVMLQAGRDTEKAIQSLSKAVRRSPGNAQYKYHLGMAYLAQSRKTDARRILTQALNLSEDFEGAEEAKRQLNLLQY